MRIKLFRGKWCAVWRQDGQTRRVSLRTDDRDTAEQRLADLRAQAARPREDTIAAVMEAYIAAGDRERARYSYKALRPFWGALRPDQICPELCREYIAQRREAVKDGTIRREITDLRSAVRAHAADKSAIFELPTPPAPRHRHITKDEYRALRDAAVSTPHLYLFLELAIATGARKTALLQLTWPQIDFPRQRIDLGIGTKNKGRAVLPMTPGAQRALVVAKQVAMTHHVIEFAGKPVLDIKKSFARAVQRAGLEDVTPHVLRHSAAVWMAEAGVPMAEIAQYLGHDSLETTRKIYARFSPDYLRGAARALEVD